MASLPEALTAADPLELGRLRDPHGVLGPYVDADPHDQAATRPAWIVAAENGLRAPRPREGRRSTEIAEVVGSELESAQLRRELSRRARP